MLGSEITVAEYMLTRLKEIGVDHLFGVHGDFVLGFFNQVIKSDLKYVGTCICAGHEKKKWLIRSKTLQQKEEVNMNNKRTMKMVLRSLISVGMLIAMFITACTMTKLTSAWKDPLYHGKPRKILVIGVAKKPINKRIFEDEFVRQLNARGTNAVASYTVMADDKQADNAVIAAKMKEQGADAVLITRLASKKTVQTYVPGTVYYPPSYYGNWRDYYGFGYEAIYTPGYTAEDEYALMEINLYDAGNDKLIWSATSETELLGSDQNQIVSYVGAMVKAMVRQKLLRK